MEATKFSYVDATGHSLIPNLPSVVDAIQS